MEEICSYCGCEAEPAVAALMADHAAIADMSYRLTKAATRDEAGWLTAELADLFERHSWTEERGLFRRLREAGEAVDAVKRLTEEHEILRKQPRAEATREVLAALARHAEMEDSDLFPFAMQQLPDRLWEGVPLSA